MKIFKAKNISRASNWKMLVYAKPGTGKTSLINYLKGKTLVFDLDNSSRVLAGDENVYIAVLDRSKPVESMADFIDSLPASIQNGGYQNIVIDNLSSFEKDWFTEQALVSKSTLNNQIKDYAAWTNYFNRMIAQIVGNKGVNILMTAWEDTSKFESPEGQTFNQYIPQIRDSVRNSLIGLLDVVGRLMVSTKPETLGQRFIMLQGNDAISAKNRLDQRVYCRADELFTFADEDTKQEKEHSEEVKEPERSDLNKDMIKRMQQYSNSIDTDISLVMNAFLNEYHQNGIKLEHLSDLNDEGMKDLIEKIKHRFAAKDTEFIEKYANKAA